MQLLYLWIEKYKNIENQGFNFSPLYRFEFKPKSNAEGKIIGGTLTDNMTDEVRKKLTKVYDGFFGQCIGNVTAIVGKNGSGKSSVLECTTDFSREPQQLNTKLLFLFQSGEEYLSYVVGFDSFDNHTRFPFRKLSSHREFEMFQLQAGYFNGIYSGKPAWKNLLASKLVSDFSTDNLAETSYSWYYSGEIRRKLRFIKFYQEKKTLFEQILNFLPAKVQFSFTAMEQTINDRLSPAYVPALNNEDILKWMLIDRIYRNEIKGFSASFEYESFKKLKEDVINLLQSQDASTLRYNNTADAVLNRIRQYLQNTPPDDILLETKTIASLDEQLEDFKQLAAALDKLQWKRPIDITDYVNSDFFERLYKIEKKYQKVIILRYGWFDNNNKEIFLSSGETAFLALIGRIYAFRENSSSKNNFLLLIDEGELGMHPQWQKQYLNMLLDALPVIFSEKQIQLILTTHSPFLVSDLPKENIIFLDRDADGKCTVADLSDKKATFGANIHTLFADSFFMDKGLMGDFAARKIKEIIDYLNGEKSLLDEDYVSVMIERIGEPIVREQLKRMLNNRLHMNWLELEKRLKKMERQVAALRKKINRNK